MGVKSIRTAGDFDLVPIKLLDIEFKITYFAHEGHSQGSSRAKEKCSTKL